MRSCVGVTGLAALLLGCAAEQPAGFTVARDAGTRDTGSSGSCEAGRVYCAGNQTYTCDANHQAINMQACAAPAATCVPDRGCLVCAPQTSRCNPTNPQQIQTCHADGSGWTNGATCDAANGASCVGGACVDRCSQSATGRSYLGCDYWPTVTANTALDPHFSFAVVVSNPQTYAVHVSVTGGSLTAPQELDLAPGAIQTVTLPWVTDLIQFNPRNPGCRALPGEMCLGAAPAVSVLRRGGAYHLHSNGPVAAYQFNPLTFERTGGYYSFSNDASLLLPQGVLTQHYTASTWPNAYSIGGTSGGFVAIVAVTGESTDVTVNPTCAVSAGAGVPALAPGADHTFSLQAGDVLELLGTGPGDLTGSVIRASQPVAVFVGHNCTTVPDGRPACDHLEEQLLPNETWGRDYLVSALRDRGPSIPSVIRMLSQADGNTLTFDPPSVHPDVTLSAGELIEFQSHDNFRVSGTQAFLVSQFMVGQGPDTTIAGGDPAMVFEVPAQQFRTSYDFYVPETYPNNLLNVVAPMGSSLLLDDMPVTAAPSAASGFNFFSLTTVGAGPHRIRTSNGMPLGIKVYGVAPYTSYMYPGGLDLQLITPG